MKKKLYVLDEPIFEAPPTGAPVAQRNAYNKCHTPFFDRLNFFTRLLKLRSFVVSDKITVEMLL